MRSLGEWSGPRAFGGLMAVACAVLSVVAIGRPGGAPVATLVLAVCAVAVLLWLPGGMGDVVAGALVFSAAFDGADELISPGPYEFDETVLGTAIPQAVTHLAWWTACLSALALVLTVALHGRKVGGAVIGGVVAVAVLAACVPGAVAVADGVGRSLVAEAAPRTTAPDDAAPVPDTTLPAELRPTWSTEPLREPFDAVEGRAIPGHGLAVLVEPETVRVVDTRTGAERWRYGLDAGHAHVSPSHRRVLLVEGRAGVVIDLVTGGTVGVIALPSAEPHVPWHPSGRQSVVLTGRTAVLGSFAVGGDSAALMSVDLVALRAARLDANPDCHYWPADGTADHAVLVRTGFQCPRPALLRFEGDRLAGMTEVGDEGDEIGLAHVVSGGVVVLVAGRRTEKAALYRDGVAEPVVFARTAQSHDLLVIVVLTGPDRVVVAGGRPSTAYDLQADRMVETHYGGRVFDVASGRLVGGAALAGDDAYGHFAQVGDRVVQVSGVDQRGLLRVRDAATFAVVGSIEVPCLPMAASANAGGVVIDCGSPGQIVAFTP